MYMERYTNRESTFDVIYAYVIHTLHTELPNIRVPDIKSFSTLTAKFNFEARTERRNNHLLVFGFKPEESEKQKV